MKNLTSKVFITSLALVSVFFIGSSFNRSEAGNKYATMRTFEGAMGSAAIVIVYDDGRTEDLDLGSLKGSNMLPNSVKINNAINSIAAKGYELVSTCAGDYVATYTFVKK